MTSPWLQRASVPAAWWAVGVGSFGMAFTRIVDPDLGFHLATGRAVLALGRIPATNVLSFTEPDHAWILHEWIPAVLFELAWRMSGPRGVLAIKLVVVVATWLLVLAAVRRLGASPLAAGVATLLGAGAAATRFTERPQIFSDLALAGCGLLLASAAAEPGRPRAGRALAAGLVAAVAAHVHAGAVTSFTLLAAVAAGLALEPLRARLFRDEPRGLSGPAGPSAYLPAAARLAALTAAAVGLAALTLALYHPHGARPLLVPFQLGADAYLHDHVVEYRSPVDVPFAPYHVYWAFTAIAAGVLLTRARRLPAVLLVPAFAFAAISLRHVRAVDAFAIATVPALALGLDGLLAARLARAAPTPPADAAGTAPPAAPPGDGPRAYGLFALAVLALGLPVDRWSFAPPGIGIAEAVWPSRMFDFIAGQHLVGPAFVSDGWAGPFLGVFYPRERAFFDPRFEAYSPGFVDGVYRSVRYGEPGWEEQLDRYGVQLVLLKYTSPAERARQQGHDNLRQRLVRSPRWALVGFGDTGELFVRRDGPNAAIVADHDIPGVEPDRGDFLLAPELVAVPLVRALDNGFTDNRVFALAAVAVDATGNHPMAHRLLDIADRQRPGDPQIREIRARLAGFAGAAER